MNDDARNRRRLRDVGRTMVEQGLTWGNAGNLSARLPDGGFLITGGGTKLGELSDEDLVACAEDGSARDPGRRPSKEVPMHRAVYRARPDLAAVLHGAPFHATLAACSRMAVPHELFVESMYELERVARVAYHHPGSTALGDAVAAAVRGADVLLLENHGVLVAGASLDEALQALQVLETTCRMVITARGAGLDLAPLPPETVEDFLEHAGYKPRRRWPT